MASTVLEGGTRPTSQAALARPTAAATSLGDISGTRAMTVSVRGSRVSMLGDMRRTLPPVTSGGRCGLEFSMVLASSRVTAATGGGSPFDIASTSQRTWERSDPGAPPAG
ncbi:MAG: hypothetical protein R2789_10245 [Microthrixaceae bacterium]